MSLLADIFHPPCDLPPRLNLWWTIFSMEASLRHAGIKGKSRNMLYDVTYTWGGAQNSKGLSSREDRDRRKASPAR